MSTSVKPDRPISILKRLPTNDILFLDSESGHLNQMIDFYLIPVLRDEQWEDTLELWTSVQDRANDLMSTVLRFIGDQKLRGRDAESILGYYLYEYRKAKGILVDLLRSGAKDESFHKHIRG